MLPITKKQLTKNYSIGRIIEPKYIAIHETDNKGRGANAMAHFNYWNNDNSAQASTHFVVDDSNIVQMLELNQRAWHVGDNSGSYSDITNNNSIGIEICVNEDGDYNKAYYNTIDLVNYLMSVTGISKENVVRHYDASGKWCPRTILDNNWWNDFKSRLGVEEVKQVETKTNGYVVTNYLPAAYEGYEGINITTILAQYFNGVTAYLRRNDKGIWIETQTLNIDKCKSLKNSLGELFYSIG